MDKHLENMSVSKLYKLGFNQAYRLTQHMPNLLKGMHVPPNEPPEYTLGFSDGQKQYEQDLSRNGIIKERDTLTSHNKRILEIRNQWEKGQSGPDNEKDHKRDNEIEP